jgi:hypothetical protein
MNLRAHQRKRGSQISLERLIRRSVVIAVVPAGVEVASLCKPDPWERRVAEGTRQDMAGGKSNQNGLQWD